MTATEIEYSALRDLLERAGSALSLAELHGGICGALCAGGRPAGREWIGDQIDDCEARFAEFDELRAMLEQLERSSWDALISYGFEFEPLLPDDGTGLDSRVTELAYWCHGFLSGLALGGIESMDSEEVSNEVEEIIQDFSEISRAGASSEDREDPEGAETSIVELAEFIRVSVQIVFEELGRQQATQEPTTIH